MLVKNSLDPSLLYLSEVFDNDETLLVDISILADYDKDAICWMVESPDILQEWGKLYRVDFYDAVNKLLEKNFFKHAPVSHKE